ncbi:MAG: HD domain-containing protein [Candidatus Omnitrophica bacterium]|nr:HD domain-containing protein [Candidatus Omnitrophota bacterium]
MDNREGSRRPYHSVSKAFKLVVVVLLFIITLVRLLLLVYFPETDIVSDKVLLFILLFISLYLWIQELRDRYYLQRLHEELKTAHEQLKQAEIDTIASLIKTEEEKDVNTRGHSERVTKIALAIAEEMGLDKKTKDTLSRGGILHDIGKIGIKDAVLHKIEKLTEEEWELIKSHPQKAIDILEPLKFLAIERNMILNHHERYDGSGYPAGRKGNEICREALILAVADAFDAMNSSRAYRQALPREKIISELKNARNTQLSAEIVDIFLKLLEKRPELWEK